MALLHTSRALRLSHQRKSGLRLGKASVFSTTKCNTLVANLGGKPRAPASKLREIHNGLILSVLQFINSPGMSKFMRGWILIINHLYFDEVALVPYDAIVSK